MRNISMIGYRKLFENLQCTVLRLIYLNLLKFGQFKIFSKAFVIVTFQIYTQLDPHYLKIKLYNPYNKNVRV